MEVERFDVSDDVLTAAALLLGDAASACKDKPRPWVREVYVQVPSHLFGPDVSASQLESEQAASWVRERLRDLIGAEWERLMVVEPYALSAGCVCIRANVHRVAIAPGGSVKVGV